MKTKIKALGLSLIITLGFFYYLAGLIEKPFMKVSKYSSKNENTTSLGSVTVSSLSNNIEVKENSRQVDSSSLDLPATPTYETLKIPNNKAVLKKPILEVKKDSEIATTQKNNPSKAPAIQSKRSSIEDKITALKATSKVKKIVEGNENNDTSDSNSSNKEPSQGDEKEEEVRVIQRFVPKMPEYARYEGVEGYVILEFFLDQEGKAIQIEVKQSSPDGYFDAIAINALKKWKYNQRKNISSKQMVRFTFSLD